MAMTLEQARRHVGAAVVYTVPHGLLTEDGIITSVNEKWVFVRYGRDRHAKATHPDNLDLESEALRTAEGPGWGSRR